MEPSRFRKRLADGETLLGLAHCYPAAGIIETIARRWDFLWIDCQHGQLSYEHALHAVRTADGMGVETLVRPPSQEPGLLGSYADLFCSGLMVPLVNNARQAAAVADAVRFPPRGNRSFGGRRPIDFLGRDYYRGHEPLLVCQIETTEALRQADEIVAIDGVDALFLGTDDLKMQLGIPVDAPNLETEPIAQAVRRVAESARNAGKYAGCVATNAESVKHCADLGYQLLVGGADVGFLRASSAERLEALRQALD